MRGGKKRKKGCAYPSSVALSFKGIDPFLCVGRHAETSSHIHEGEWSAAALCTSTLMEKLLFSASEHTVKSYCHLRLGHSCKFCFRFLLNHCDR